MIHEKLTGSEALKKVLSMKFDNVLDIGSGAGEHAEIFKRLKKDVTTISLEPPATYIMDFNDAASNWGNRYQCVWACHVLEHQIDVNSFLRRCKYVLAENGIFAVTVPPLKHQIVGGHVTLWNAGLLLYNLILAGFDCSNAMVKQYGYNISVIVRNKTAELPTLRMDNGDIDALKEYFPLDVKQGFDGQIMELNW